MKITRRQALTGALATTLSLHLTSRAAADDLGLWAGGAKIRRPEKFPLYKQPDGISCGPTCLSMVLGYYGISAGIGPLKTAAGTRMFSYNGNEVGLTRPSGMLDAMKSYGLGGSMFRASLDEVTKLIDQDRPPILLVRSGVKTWHYVTAIGYQHGTSKILLADPATGTSYYISGANLDKGWTFSGEYSTGNSIQGRTCRLCGGNGQIGGGWTNCGTCGGTGKWKAGPLWTKCGTCGGSGKWTGPKTKCHYCDGDGRETDFFRKVVEQVTSGHTLIVPSRAAHSVGGSSGGSTSGGSNGGSSSALKTYHIVSIRNTTSSVVKFQLRPQADMPWVSREVEPGKYFFQWTSGTPGFAARFDRNLTTGVQQQTLVNLSHTTVKQSSPPGYAESAKYSFVRRSGSSGATLALVSG